MNITYVVKTPHSHPSAPAPGVQSPPVPDVQQVSRSTRARLTASRRPAGLV